MDEDKANNSMMDLVAVVRDIFEAEAAKDSGAAPQLQRALTLMQELQPDPDRSEAKEQPGCWHPSHS